MQSSERLQGSHRRLPEDRGPWMEAISMREADADAVPLTFYTQRHQLKSTQSWPEECLCVCFVCGDDELVLTKYFTHVISFKGAWQRELFQSDQWPNQREESLVWIVVEFSKGQKCQIIEKKHWQWVGGKSQSLQQEGQRFVPLNCYCSYCLLSQYHIFLWSERCDKSSILTDGSDREEWTFDA